MKIPEIKEKIMITDFLEKLGFKPARHSGGEVFFNSPYRDDPGPSFTVNDKKGLWYDHGDGRGGTVIDLALLVYQTPDVKEVVKKINQLYQGANHALLIEKRQQLDAEPHIDPHKIVAIKDLGNNLAISSYLDSRAVLNAALQIAIIKEVYYDFTNKQGVTKRYYGAGWKNVADGWALRNKYGKVNISHQGITLLEGKSGVINIFEGMMDLLSGLTEKEVSFEDTNIVMNTTGHYKTVIQFITDQQYSAIKLYLDHGTGGDKFTAVFKEQFPKAIDKRHVFAGFGDYNEKLEHYQKEKKARSVDR